MMFFLIWIQSAFAEQDTKSKNSTVKGTGALVEEVEKGEDLATSHSVFTQALSSGPVVFSVLLILVFMSIAAWGIVIAKYFYMQRLEKAGQEFLVKFWESRSLNDLNAKVNDFEYSPERELFKRGYAELVKGNQLKNQVGGSELFVQSSMENLGRILNKARILERQNLEKFVPSLAICASAAPFIGLFGTVWGIMRAFEGIAQRGDASLSAVAPGISEALIATAFGLAAAIPAAIGYNIFSAKIRKLMVAIDGFSVDFLNIVERYLVGERAKLQNQKNNS